MTSTPHHHTGTRAGSLLTAVAFAFGIPTLLWRAAGWPLPSRLPSGDLIGDVLAGDWRPDDGVVIGVLALIGWAVWAQIAVATTAEIKRARSGRAGRTLPLSAWCRPLAIRLAATLAVVAPFAPRAAGAVTVPPARPAVVSTVAVPGHVLQAEAVAPPAVAPDQSTTVYTVRPGDTLWDLAHDHLGDPLRWKELFDLNRGRPQPDGRHLEDPGLLRPHWELLLPIPAAPAGPTATTQPAPTPEPVESHDPVAAPTREGDRAVDMPAAAAPAAAEADPAPTESAPNEAPGGPSLPGSAIAQIGLPSLTAGVVLGYLGALRRDRERRRRPRQRIVRSTTPQEQAERTLRAVAPSAAPTWVDLAMRHLASSLQAEGAPPPPSILAVRAGDLGVEILISPPWPVAPGRFVPLDDGHTWRLDPALDLHELRDLTAGMPAYVPALVTVGDTDAGAVLLDLDETGSLLLEGPADRVEPILTAMATELAAAPWSENCDIYLVGLDPRLANLDRVHRLDADQAVPELCRGIGGTGTRGLADGARADIPAAPTIALIGPGALRPEDLQALLTAAQPHSGLSVVAAGVATGCRARLAACPDGTAVLYPLGLSVTTANATRTADDLVSLLATTATGPTDALGTSGAATDSDAEGSDEDSQELTLTEEPAPGQLFEPLPVVEPVVTVSVLGPVEITWQGTVPKRQVAEFVSYLATHPRGVTSDQARLALWPASADDERFGERAPATFWSLTTKARRALGQDHDGNVLIVREANNVLRLSPGVACDWTEFERLTAAARKADDQAAELLTHALSLVRGRPFEDASWAWVEVERLDGVIEAAVADAATHLADLALAAEDLDTARFAVDRGLRAVPHSETLLRALMRTCAAAGDRAGVDRAWRDAQRLAASLDPLGQPEPETTALYESLRARTDDT